MHSTNKVKQIQSGRPDGESTATALIYRSCHEILYDKGIYKQENGLKWLKFPYEQKNGRLRPAHFA